MVSGRNKNEQNIISRVLEAGQGQVFRFWDTLTDTEKTSLISQLESIDFDLIDTLYSELAEQGASGIEQHDLEPAPYIALPRTASQQKRALQAKTLGEQALRSGRVAAFLVAGGQGTRLGFDGPKGCFPASPVTGKTLFQIHAEKIAAASRKYNVPVPWYIMTSQANHSATVAYFEENSFLGLPRTDVMFFKQDMLPAVDKQGKLILDRPWHVFMNPNGHGGSFAALHNSGALDDMEKRSIDIISYFQVDNVLVTIIDPVFIGYHLMEKAEMSSKMAVKTGPGEKVGVFGIRDSRLVVVEYSDLSEEQMTAANQDGSLQYGAGSIAIHLIQREFVRKNMQKGMRLPFHSAHKKIPFLDTEGNVTKPETPNGYKFETFVFDALSRTTASAIMEIDRACEFSPVKNSDGIDSPDTAKQHMSNLFGSWLEKCGITVPRDKKGNVTVNIEISPLYAADAQELAAKCPATLECSHDIYLGPETL